MIRYPKGAEPRCLAIYRSTPGMAWPPQGEDSGTIRDALLRDQSFLCAYCQRRIENFDRFAAPPESRQMRIEHWAARSTGGPPFVWNNLLGCCSGRSGPHPAEGDGAGPSDHCDRSKADEALFLHPVNGQGPDPAAFLKYTPRGDMTADDTRAAENIQTLNLNCPPLVRSRAAVFDGVRQRLGKGAASMATLNELVERHTGRPGERVPPHSPMVLYFANRWLQRGRPRP